MINQPTFTKHYNTFDNISKIYSNEFPEGKVLDLLVIRKMVLIVMKVTKH